MVGLMAFDPALNLATQLGRGLKPKLVQRVAAADVPDLSAMLLANNVSPDIEIDVAPFSFAGGDVTNTVVSSHGTTRTIASVVTDYGYDATSDIQLARTLGATDDAPALNTALANNRAVCFRSEVGQVIANTSILIQQRNQRLTALGGTQAASISRGLGNPGSTLIAGKADGSAPAGGLVLDGLWFTHAGRLGYSGGALPGLLTGDQSHIEVWQGQAVRIHNCGGYGARHGISVFATGGILIDNPFFFGSVWNPLDATAQEAISHIRFGSSALGHTVNAIVRSPQLYGENAIGQQSRTIGAKTVSAQMQVGPQHGILVQSVECLLIDGGFVGEYAVNAVTFQAKNTYDVLQRAIIKAVYLDQSNNAQVATARTDATYPLLDGLDIQGCGINGQQLGTWGLYCDGSASVPSVRRLSVSNTKCRATLASAAFLNGVDNGNFNAFDAAGYNEADNTDPGYSSGIYAAAGAQDVHVRNAQFGGGDNAFTDANNCLYGVYGASGSTIDYGDIRARNMGASSAALTGGTITRAAF